MKPSVSVLDTSLRAKATLKTTSFLPEDKFYERQVCLATLRLEPKKNMPSSAGTNGPLKPTWALSRHKSLYRATYWMKPIGALLDTKNLRASWQLKPIGRVPGDKIYERRVCLASTYLKPMFKVPSSAGTNEMMKPIRMLFRHTKVLYRANSRMKPT